MYKKNETGWGFAEHICVSPTLDVWFFCSVFFISNCNFFHFYILFLYYLQRNESKVSDIYIQVEFKVSMVKCFRKEKIEKKYFNWLYRRASFITRAHYCPSPKTLLRLPNSRFGFMFVLFLKKIKVCQSTEPYTHT